MPVPDAQVSAFSLQETPKCVFVMSRHDATVRAAQCQHHTREVADTDHREQIVTARIDQLPEMQILDDESGKLTGEVV